MSKTFELVCHETKQRLWIGQGATRLSHWYTTPKHLEDLRKFLDATRGRPLVLLCDDTESGDWQDYEDFAERANSPEIEALSGAARSAASS